MGDREEGNLVGIKGYEEFDLNDPNFKKFIKMRMKKFDQDEQEAIDAFLKEQKEHYAKKNKKAHGGSIKKHKKGGYVKSSAQTSVIPGARAKGSAEGSTIPGAKAKGSAEGSTIKMTPMKMKHGGDPKKGSMLSITIEKKPIDKKTMNMIKKAEKTGNVLKMKSGGAAKRGYGKARR